MPPLTDGGLTPYKLLSVVEELRSIGLDDGVIKEAIEPERYKVTREEMQKVVQLQGELFGDKEWVRRLLDGGEKERRTRSSRSCSGTFRRPDDHEAARR